MESLTTFRGFRFPISPLQSVHHPVFDHASIKVYIKRDDLIDPFISGNKWRKLQYNLLEMDRLEKKGIVTFGGAFSNHLYAVAAAGNRFGFLTIGIVRGERPRLLSSTLQFCEEMGMVFYFVSREGYQMKEGSKEVKAILLAHQDCFVVPEGGANTFGEKGCTEIWDELNLPIDFLCLACGTGTTLKGLSAQNTAQVSLMGFSVLKGLEAYPPLTSKDCQVISNYHFGGYGRHTEELFSFIRNFEKETDIPLEQVYTGKMFYGIVDLIQKGHFLEGSRIVALHTGGLQGRSPLI